MATEAATASADAGLATDLYRRMLPIRGFGDRVQGLFLRGEGYGGRRQMSAPEVEKVQPGDSATFGRIVPIYAGPADHQHPALRKLLKRLCDEYAPFAVDDLPAEVREAIGADLERTFAFLFEKLKVQGTRGITDRWVRPPALSHDAPRAATVAAPDDMEAGE